jgi:hypothetical protein
VSAQAGHFATDPTTHVVRFYDHDDELARTVGDDLGRRLADGAAVVVVAAADHRDAIEARMMTAGGDIVAARQDGRYQALDAAVTMGRFLTGDEPDAAMFEQVIGEVIRRAAAAGQPVLIFGEMVALLWDSGQVAAAIEVEALWNELAALVPFSLMCGYATASVLGDDHADALETMCGLHTAVAGHVPRGNGAPPRAERHTARAFPLSRFAPREARHFVARTLGEWGDSALIPDAGIIVGELAANAFLHARTGFTVAVSRTLDLVRIEVQDSGAAGTRQHPVLAAVQGHGLAAVAVVSARWAAERLPAGKVVWAELTRVQDPELA